MVLLLVGCAAPSGNKSYSETDEDGNEYQKMSIPSIEDIDWIEEMPEVSAINDEQFLQYLRDELYYNTVADIESEGSIITQVNTMYLSKEYLEERAYNSRENIFFGYSLSELDEFFGETKYVFSLGENGETVVQEMKAISEEEINARLLKNVAIGAGVILVSTVVITSVMGNPVKIPFLISLSAKGWQGALSRAATHIIVDAAKEMLVKFITVGVKSAVTTGDFSEAIEVAARAGIDGFKWGAVCGLVDYATEKVPALSAFSGRLKDYVKDELSAEQVEEIQKDLGYPLEMIRAFQSYEDYLLFKNDGITPYPVNGRWALIRSDIAPNKKDANGLTNVERMKKGLAPLDDEGREYQLNFVGKGEETVPAILSFTEVNNPVFIKYIHNEKYSTNELDKIRVSFWKAFVGQFW